METGQVCETWDLTLKLGSCTTQEILSVLDPVVKVSNIMWSAYLQAECTYRCRADCITGFCAATDVCFMLRSPALSQVLQSRQHRQSQCSNRCQVCAVQSRVKPSAAVTMLHCTCLVQDCAV